MPEQFSSATCCVRPSDIHVQRNEFRPFLDTVLIMCVYSKIYVQKEYIQNGLET